VLKVRIKGWINPQRSWKNVIPLLIQGGDHSLGEEEAEGQSQSLLWLSNSLGHQFSFPKKKKSRPLSMPRGASPENRTESGRKQTFGINDQSRKKDLS